MPVNVRVGAVVRSRDEEHRASTPLELFFDLTFVVAVAQVSAELHHALVERHFAEGVIGFTTLFVAVWWAWMTFTWFASAHDADDVTYRLLTFVQMAGALVLAAGVHDAFESRDFATVTVGYVIMRLPMVTQWLRVAAQHPEIRTRAMRYAVGIAVVQVLWLARLALPHSWSLASWVVLMAAELTVPWVAERSGSRPIFHPGHIVERYGLFMIIVLGESILSATVAVQQSIAASGVSPELLAVAAGTLLIAFAMWWIYFEHQDDVDIDVGWNAFVWGYGHLPVFAGLAAVGAGVQVAVDALDGEVSERVGAMAIAVPVTVVLLGTALLSGLLRTPDWVEITRTKVVAAAIVLLLGAVAPIGVAVLASGLVLATIVGVWIWHDRAEEAA